LLLLFFAFIEIHDQEGEGCITKGYVKVAKVAGNLHLAIGASHKNHEKHLHKFKLGDMKHFNASHTINELSFGDYIPNQKNPLQKHAQITQEGIGHFQYFIKVVPMTHIDAQNVTSDSNEYTYTEKVTVINTDKPLAAGGIPGVFFVYDYSPFRVVTVESTVSFSSFIVSCCAIIGGVVSIAGILDSAIYYMFGNSKK
jgi:hypothetical protein